MACLASGVQLPNQSHAAYIDSLGAAEKASIKSEHVK